MSKYKTILTDLDLALAFLQNMRWFADVGRIKVTPLGNGRASVRARRDTLSHFVWSSK